MAGFQTAYFRTGNVKYLQLTKFFGKLFLINFAMGVVTGIVQEFQFGMNWSDYSRFVGDVFGVPLALYRRCEAGAVGLLHPRRPVPRHGVRGLLPHADGLVPRIGCRSRRCQRLDDDEEPAVRPVPPAAKLGAWVILVSAVLVSVSGDMDMKVMVAQQPMKVAAAEAQYATQESAPFSILSVGGLSGDSATNVLEVPGLLSWLATGNWSGASSTAQGINDLTAPYVATYGPGNYVPYVPVTYCGFRLMIGLGMLAPLYALIALWAFRGGRIPKNRLFALFNSVIPLFPLFPLFGISAGWIFTELGRQPWIVFGQQLTALVQWLPLGMDTDVGVLGVAVSGGEGQRRALARLLLARVRFVVLDEPTEHIDAATAGSLVATTTLLITHRLTELGVVDRIIELQDGRIDAEGSHPALMALQGWYAEQWQAESDLRGMAQNVPTLPIGIAVAVPAA